VNDHLRIKVRKNDSTLEAEPETLERRDRQPSGLQKFPFFQSRAKQGRQGILACYGCIADSQ
jgi:hypothetical protein